MNHEAPRSPIDEQLAAPPVSPPPVQMPNSTETGNSMSTLVQNRLAVIGVLFGVTGFLGIPLLWMNKRFSNSERVFWAILVTIYTLILIYIAWAICAWSYRQIFG